MTEREWMEFCCTDGREESVRSRAGELAEASWSLGWGDGEKGEGGGEKEREGKGVKVSRAVDGTAVRHRLVRISESRDCRSVGSRFPLEEVASAAAAGKSHSRHGDRHPRLAPSLQAYLRRERDYQRCVGVRVCVSWPCLCVA